jgi:hypothetical protein
MVLASAIIICTPNKTFKKLSKHYNCYFVSVELMSDWVES